MTLLEPADVPLAGIPSPYVALVILLTAILLFFYVMYRRIHVLTQALPDERFSNIGERIRLALVYGFGQARQPRYLVAGILHILLFAGFIILSLRSLTLIGRGFSSDFHLPLLTGAVGFGYEVLKDYVVLIVLIVCVVAMIRRAVFHPARYEHPAGSKGHGSEAYIILGMVSALMVTDILFDGSSLLIKATQDGALGGFGQVWKYFPGALTGALALSGVDITSLGGIHVGAYWAHIIVFLSLLNYLPISKHFHVITAIPNVFFANLNKGAIKPVQCGVDDWMELESCGIGSFNQFTWKHILDFYSCADCGRCSDNCPAATVGRALSPRMISIKARDYAYEHFPVFGTGPDSDESQFTGDVVTQEEIWACTTCGACEQECPIFIEYINKIVDMRRYLIEEHKSLPQSMQKAIEQIYKKGNAYGGSKTKRAAWTKELEEDVEVKVLKKGQATDILFFVDSCGSFDPRIQEISKSLARILTRAGIDFGILGVDESDSGNEVRRLGEEGLFEQVSKKNIAAFEARNFKEITAFDPHAFNAIKNDYPVKFPVTHASQLLAKLIRESKIKLRGDLLEGRLVTYHDPCYLGRHNGVYQEPRFVLNSIPGIRFQDMKRSYSRSFCCSGGGLLLWYENDEEKERMGEVRVRMAEEIGAQVIVTACPFCLINLEDAVKTTNNEGNIEIIDMVELVDRCSA
jgi:Fe-S oxidoreductase